MARGYGATLTRDPDRPAHAVRLTTLDSGAACSILLVERWSTTAKLEDVMGGMREHVGHDVAIREHDGDVTLECDTCGVYIDAED